MVPPVHAPMQPRPDPFEGVLREIFDKACVTRGMVRAVTPLAVSGRTYDQLDEAAQEQIHRVLEMCTRFVANLLLPTDGKALHTSFVDGEDPKLTMPTLVRGYVAATRGSIGRRVLRAALSSCWVDLKIDCMLHELDEHGDDSTGFDAGAGRNGTMMVCEKVARRWGSIEGGEDVCTASPGTTIASSSTIFV